MQIGVLLKPAQDWWPRSRSRRGGQTRPNVFACTQPVPGQHPVSIRPAPDQCAGAQGHRFFHGVEALLTRSGHGPHTGRRLSPVDKRGAFLLKNVAERYMPRIWPGAGQIGLRLWRVRSLNQGRIRAYCRFWAAARRFSAPTGRGAVAVGGLHGASLFARRVWQMTRHSQPVRGMNEQK